MPKPLRTLFLIADGRRARWVARDHETHAFRTVRELHSSGKTAHAYSGAVFESATGQRHGAREPHEPAHRQAEAFAAELAAELREVKERLVIVAPPRMLASLMDELAQETRSKLADTLPKDLTNVPDHQLGRWLEPLER